jgi:hypothetical protein
MMISFRSSIVLLVTAFILLSSGCANYSKNNSEAEKFLQSRNSFADSVEQLKKESGITITGFASDQEKLLIKVGIGIDRHNISDARFKEIINKYIGNLPQEILEPYKLEIEEIDKEKGSSWLMAEKSANTTIINWIQ